MLEPYDGEINEFYIDVFVKNPRVEDGSYISYEIIIETNNISFTASKSSVRRRYSEFAQLYKLLAKEFPAWKLPSLPPKYPFKDNFHPAFVERRRNRLQEFLINVVSQKIYLSSKALHLFLQSNHSVPEIKDIIHGNKAPVETFSNGFINSRLPALDSSSNISDENSIHSVSSHAEVDVNVNSYLAHSSSDYLNISAKSDNNLPSEGKRVSFCDQVIVAQILVD